MLLLFGTKLGKFSKEGIDFPCSLFLALSLSNLASNEENNEKYIFGIFNFFLVLIYSRSDKAELVQPFSNDLFQCTVSPALV